MVNLSFITIRLLSAASTKKESKVCVRINEIIPDKKVK